MTLEVGQYVKKRVVVSAVQLTFDNAPEVAAWCEGHFDLLSTAGKATVIIPTPEGPMRFEAWRDHPDDGPFVLQGIEGEFYPCRASIFRSSYEAVP